MPKKLDECIKKVMKSNKNNYGYQKYNAYAVCKSALKLNKKGGKK